MKLSAHNEIMADQTVKMVVNAQDNASAVLKDTASNFDNLNAKAKAAAKAAVDASDKFALGLLGVGAAVGGLGVYALNAAADLEQVRVGFTTMLGSAQKANDFITQLQDFAQKTPFTLKGLETASTQLLAFGVGQKDVIPDLTILGNIASGVGMDKLPNLIHAFGQVQISTKLTGRELNEFNFNSVPLLQALTDQINKAGGAMTVVAGNSEKVGAKTSTLNETLAKQNNRLAEMVAAHKTTSASYKNLLLDIEATKDKIASLPAVTQDFTTKTKMTVAELKKAIDDGMVIPFSQVKDALASLSEKGGLYYNLMAEQMKTFNGAVSNLQDAWERFLTTQGARFLGWATQFILIVTDIVTNVLPVWADRIATVTKFFIDHKEAIIILVGVIMGGLYLAIKAATTAFVDMAIVLAPYMLTGFLIAGLVAGVYYLYNNWTKVWGELKTFVSDVFVAMGWSVNDQIEFIKSLHREWDILAPAIKTTIETVVATFKWWYDQIKPIIDDMMMILSPLINAMTRLGSMFTSFGVTSSSTQAILNSGNAGNSFVGPSASLKAVTSHASGGMIPGEFGSAQLAMVHAGERIIPNSSAYDQGINVTITGNNISSDLDIRDLAKQVGDQIMRSLRQAQSI